MPSRCSLKYNITPEFNLYTYDTCRSSCVLSLAAPDVDDAERAPVSCTFVLDISGSMSGSKLALMRKASQFSLRQLAAKDYLGILAFDSEVRLRHGHVPSGPSLTSPANYSAWCLLQDVLMFAGCLHLSHVPHSRTCALPVRALGLNFI